MFSVRAVIIIQSTRPLPCDNADNIAQALLLLAVLCDLAVALEVVGLIVALTLSLVNINDVSK